MIDLCTKPRRVLAALLLVIASSASEASVIVLDFEGIGNQASVLDFYNGGTDSMGNPGTNYGISFGSNSLAITDFDAGGSGNFANEPSPDSVLFFLTGSAILNYAPGFDTGFSFFYSSATVASVFIYDQINAAGNLLATLNLSAQYDVGCAGDPNGQYCNWTAVGASFAGLARSIDFGGTVNRIGYDNITFGSATAGGPPTVAASAPPSFMILLLGLGLLIRKRLGLKSH
jgi:hypothetical protein